MSIIDLNRYRNSQRKAWFSKHRIKLEKVVSNYLDVSFGIPFEDLQHLHIQSSCTGQHTSWDYIDFRELLLESMERIISDKLWEELSYYPWFNPNLFTKDELVYFAFELYVSKDRSHIQILEK